MREIDKSILNRKTYKAIKKMDRQEMEGFIKSLAKDQYKKGVEAGKEIISSTDTKMELLQFLQDLDIKGIGGKTKDKILQAYKKRGK